MILLQLLSEVPEWARRRGLDDKSFDLLEQIALNPAKKEELLCHVEYGKACGILLALEYAVDKGLV